MSILSGPEIAKIIRRTRTDLGDGSPLMLPAINVTPFNPANVGPNSIDVTLGSKLLCYELNQMDEDGCPRFWLDSKQKNTTYEFEIPDAGLVIRPGVLYLGSTVEVVEAHGVVPTIETRSSVARLGIVSHLCAGFCDDGWNGQLTYEITCVIPVKIYAGMRFAQISFTTLQGERKPYIGKYNGSVGPLASRMHEDK